MVFAMQVTRTGNLAAGNPSVGNHQASSLRYFHHDHLGSTGAVSDEAGQVIERMAYDLWGKRRNTNGLIDATDSVNGLTTDRGYTFHEHLDEMGIIHMNGRLFDPLIGRFMSADPFIQSPENLQSYNRYSYVMNNPLAYTDPSGYWSFKKLFKIAVIVAVGYFTGGAVMNWIIPSGLGAPSIGLSIIGGAAGGFAAGVAATGTLKGGLQGAFSGAVFGAIGGAGAVGGWGSEAFVAAHAAGGCITSVASGGKCGSGALSAAFGKCKRSGNYTPCAKAGLVVV
jgi:RHS repeat-associated protein